MNIFLEDIVDLDRARRTVLEVLGNAQALEDVVVAFRIYSEESEEDAENDGYTILWPPDFKGEFNVLGL